jgi:pimeloyl-ACP methyl ester carboxylesterase
MAAIQMAAREVEDVEPPSIETNGTRLYYIEQGSGEPVLFVHGSLGDYRTWTGVLDRFSKDYRAISYSRRYAYPNRWMEGGDDGIAANAEDLYGLIGSLGLGPVHIVGHSYGAFTAIVCARRHPQVVRSLILEEPPLLPMIVADPNNPREILSLFRKSPRAALALIKFGEQAIAPAMKAFAQGDAQGAARFFLRGVLGHRIVVEELPLLSRQGLLANAESLEQESDKGMVPFSCEDARRISAPVLLIGGERSPYFFTHILDRLQQCLPNSRRLTLSAVSHDLHLADPEGFVRAALAFLKEQPK